MAENYAAGLKGVISGLQSNCRSESKGNIEKCKRAIEERMIINEVALSTDIPSQKWRASQQASLSDCLDNCRINGRTKIRECNTVCSNNLIQGLWKRINIIEYEQIAAKYA